MEVDLATGAIKKLEPEQIVAQLSSQGANVELWEDHLYIFVTLGQLESPGEDIARLQPE